MMLPKDLSYFFMGKLIMCLIALLEIETALQFSLVQFPFHLLSAG